VTQQAHQSRVWPVISLVAAGCLWGTGFVFGKIAFAEMSVSENVGYRLIFGWLGLTPILWKSPPNFHRDAWGVLVAASIVGVPIQFLLQFKGLEATTVYHASLIVGALPVLLAVSSAVLLKEKLRAFEYGLIAISAAGAVLIAMAKSTVGGSQPTLSGDLLIFGSMFAAMVMIIVSKRLMDEYGSLQVTAWLMAIATAVLLVWVEARHPMQAHFALPIWLAVIAQGILPTTAAFLFWNWGLARVPAARAGVFLNLEPLVGTLLGVLVLGESLGALGILGGLFILPAAAYFSRPKAA
jgi:drug/metabolite transporter (DMT)-like permease